MLLHGDGFDVSRDATTFARRYTVLQATSATYGVTGTRGGGYAVNGGSGGSLRYQVGPLDSAEPTRWTVGFHVKAHNPSDGEGLVILKNTSDQETLALEIFKAGDTDGSFFFKLRVGEAVLFTTRRYVPDVWHFVELSVHSSYTSGSVEVRVNGIVQDQVSGVPTSAQTNGNLAILRLGQVGAGGNDYVTIDNLYLTDGAGAVSGFLGEVSIEPLWPTFGHRWGLASGFTATAPVLVPGAEGADAVDDGLDGTVDDDTSYVSCTGTGGAFWEMRDPNVTRALIYGIVVRADVRLVSGSGDTVTFIRVAGPEGKAGIGEISDQITIPGTSYANVGTISETLPDGRRWSWETIEETDLGVSVLGSNTKRLTRFWVEVVARTEDAVTPVALDAVQPEVLLGNYRHGTRTTTTWSTDVQKAKGTLAQDRLGLCARPARIVDAEVTGLRKRNAVAAILAQARRTHAQSYAPIYSDFVRLAQDALATTSTVQVDTRWRRFYIGQRIAIVDVDLTDLSGGDFELATIAAIYPAALVLTAPLENTFVALRARVYPLIDCEVALDAGGTYSNREIVTTAVSAIEIRGANTLPPTWDGMPFGHCPVRSQDGLPIFDLRFNWQEEPTVRIVREGERFDSGRSSIVTPSGARGTWTFAGKFTWTRRKGFWPVLQFFDRCRGRLHPFWFLAPGNLFTVTATTSTSATIRALDPQTDVGELFEHVAFVTSGETAILEVDALTYLGDGLQRIDFATSGVPALADIRRTALAFLCQWASDTLEEDWFTDESGECRIEVQEVQREGTAGVENLVPLVSSAGAPSEIDDLAIWLDAQGQQYSSDVIAGVYRRSAQYPATLSGTDFWFDQRMIVPDAIYGSLVPPNRFVAVGTTVSTVPWRGRLYSGWKNRGLSAMVNGAFYYHRCADVTSTIREIEFWSNTKGMTLFHAWIGGDDRAWTGVQDSNFVVMTESATSQTCFQWLARINTTQGLLRLFAIPGVNNANYQIVHPTFETQAPSLAWVRWVPGVSIEHWINGTLQTAAGSPASFPNVVGYNVPTWFNYFYQGQQPGRQVIDGLYGKRPMMLAFLAYRRALSDQEIAAVRAYLASVYLTP